MFIYSDMKVIIVGGGFCGALVAKKLEKNKDIELTLLDKKQYFEYRPGLPKLIRKKNYLKNIQIKYKKFLKNTKIICEKVESITPKKIKTNKNEYNYDILVLCCGIKYPIFLKNTKNVFTVTESTQCLKAIEKIEKSKKILIVGGGLIGVEVAGELVTQKQDKAITIVHSKNRLIERNPRYASKISQKFLEKKDVKIIFNEKIIENNENSFVTDKNRKINADTAIWSAGTKCDSSFMKNFNKNIFTEKGCLKVDNYLRLKEYHNIFVGGDITNINEEKTAQNSERNAKIIAKNIKKIIEKRRLVKYNKFKGPLFISLGSKKGIFVFRNISFSGFIPTFIKDIIENWFFNMIR